MHLQMWYITLKKLSETWFSQFLDIYQIDEYNAVYCERSDEYVATSIFMKSSRRY